MKSPMLLMQCVLADCERRCCVSTARDLETITGRFESEGLSFLTITLANFGKDFEQMLKNHRGNVTRELFKGFKKIPGDSGIPAFLQGFFELILDRNSGLLLENPSTDAIQAIRQITLMWAKMQLPCSDARNVAAVDGYLQCEDDLRWHHPLYDFVGNITPQQEAYNAKLVTDFGKMRDILFSDVMSKMDKAIDLGELLPKHGPGATADGLKANAKYDQMEWTERLEAVFPFLDNALPNPRYHSALESVRFLPPGEERPVKVTLVPKTLSTPRIIAIEPTCMQYMQQAISVQLVQYLEDPRSFASGFLGFYHQEPNQLMAKTGSQTGLLATLDLSEASDRVDNRLVCDMFRPYTNLAEGIQACRSTRADVPGKGVIPLVKFASMGSALTFPIEAMVFLIIVMIAIQEAEGHRLSKNDVLSFKGQVRVYGDDIVVPAQYARSVVRILENFGFRVNARKSFWTGKFRESCGKEYYDGVDVSIVKLRREIPDSRSNVREIISTVETRNQFYEHGRWESVEFLDDAVINALQYFPYIEESSSLLGRVGPFEPMAERIDKDLQVPLVKGWKKVAKSPVSNLDGLGALQKFFLKKGLEPFFNEDHMERYGRPDAVSIKLGYGQPY